VTVTMNDGSVYVGEVAYPKGDPEYPATREEVVEKFRNNAANTIGTGHHADAHKDDENGDANTRGD
ncbi:MAG: MmgE/PrpD family protein, partial [Shewanella sp.]|nr:MmgE/PrpD family protein [Shewanella sp.]